MVRFLWAVACVGLGACSYPTLPPVGAAPCNAGDVRDCYDGPAVTDGVGLCRRGQQTCGGDGAWGACTGQVLPAAETCNDSRDNNCNGMTDEDVDADGDGVTTCAGDCCDSTECPDPAQVNPGAFEIERNGVDDDCDRAVDNVARCDSGLASNSSTGLDYAKALDLCKTTTGTQRNWGVISASFALASGSGTPAAVSRSIRTHYGANVLPRAGASFALLSTGAAASVGDTNPNYFDLQMGTKPGTASGFPADFLAANGNTLPNAPGCPAPSGSMANDPIMLILNVRVPTNARSFRLRANFFTSEFPEYVCSQFNDFFVVLLDSGYTGPSPNPVDKNLAFYRQTPTSQPVPVGVNLAGRTNLFTQCVNGTIGCATGATPSTINSCTGTDELVSTGLDNGDPGQCDATSRKGGGTSWLDIHGNVVPGEVIILRIAIWDTSDEELDSLVVLDDFQWSTTTTIPGTVRE